MAILPQLFQLQKTGDVETLTSHYVFTLGAYRALYLLNWIYRVFTGDSGSITWVVWVTGILQTALYMDFFYYYIKSKYYGVKLQLPA